MGLKPFRQVIATETGFAASGAMERGGIASYIPWADGLVYYPTGSGQTPAGLVLEDIEDINYMKQFEPLMRNVSPYGSPVGLATEGVFWTNMIDTNLTYKSGEALYLIGAGKMTNQRSMDTATEKMVAVCLQGKDSDNYIKVKLDIDLSSIVL